MPLKLFKIVVYGLDTQVELKTNSLSHEHMGGNHELEYGKIDAIVFQTDDNFLSILQSWEPDLVVVVGNITSFHNINKHFDTLKSKLYLFSLEEWNRYGESYLSDLLFQRYISNSIKNYDSQNKISVYTASYNTKDKLLVAYESLEKQTHQNWEWSIYDDSSDDETWEAVKSLAKRDSRIIINKNNNQSLYSRIGLNKFNAAVNCSSKYIIELDHDDAFTHDALEKILLTHIKHPDCGFVYGDWTEMNRDTYQEYDYGECFAWGYGKLYDATHPFLDRPMKVVGAPNVNPLTIRRLWSLYNHPKSWKRDVYMKIGGHNKFLNSADDYEMMIRTFLNTKMVHLNHFCYIQYMYNNNTKVSSGGLGSNYHTDIFRHVRVIENHYREQIKKRFEDLGKVDWAYQPLKKDCLEDFYKGKGKYPFDENNVNLEFKP